MDLLDKDFIPPISNMFKELEIMSKELNESMRMTFHQIKNTNKQTETIKRNQIDIFELKSNGNENFTRGFQQQI